MVKSKTNASSLHRHSANTKSLESRLLHNFALYTKLNLVQDYILMHSGWLDKIFGPMWPETCIWLTSINRLGRLM